MKNRHYLAMLSMVDFFGIRRNSRLFSWSFSTSSLNVPRDTTDDFSRYRNPKLQHQLSFIPFVIAHTNISAGLDHLHHDGEHVVIGLSPHREVPVLQKSRLPNKSLGKSKRRGKNQSKCRLSLIRSLCGVVRTGNIPDSGFPAIDDTCE